MCTRTRVYTSFTCTHTRECLMICVASCTHLLTPWPSPCGGGGVGKAARDTPPVQMLRHHSRPQRVSITHTVPPSVAQTYSTPRKRGTQHTFIPNRGAPNTYTTPISVGCPSPTRYLPASPMPTPSPRTGHPPHLHSFPK